MPSLYHPRTTAAIHTRVDRLTRETQPLWGRMNVAQMMVHCRRQLEMGLGELKTAPFRSPAGWFPFKQLIIYDLLPRPRGVPTLPELRDPVTGEWQQERDQLTGTIDRFAGIPATTPMPVHGAFGALSHDQWGRLAWVHLDHHLGQFGA